VRKSTADEETDLNGFANPMAKGAYVEDGWVDESAASSSGPGFFGTLFGGGKSASASKMAQQDALNRELDVIEFVDGTKGSLTDAARGGTAVPFGGLNPAQVAAYDVDGQKEDEVKKPWGGYAPMPESAVEFFKECVLLLQNVFSYYRMCSLTTECVLLLQVCAHARKCSRVLHQVSRESPKQVAPCWLVHGRRRGVGAGVLLQGGRHHHLGAPLSVRPNGGGGGGVGIFCGSYRAALP